jgi:hypothetical protein
MSNDLVERLRDFDPHLHEWEVVDEAADYIEALTAERDKAYASGYSDAETEISKSALGQKNAFLNAEYSNAAGRVKALTEDFALQVQRTDEQRAAYEQALAIMEADNARLREALNAVELARMTDEPEHWQRATDLTDAALNTGKADK